MPSAYRLASSRWIVLCLAASSSGCASLVSGTSQQVRIDTHPDAKTQVDGRTFVGPARVSLHRRGRHVLRVEKSGFVGRELELQPRMNGWVWGNLALGPLFPLGVVIDALTGAIHDLSPAKVRVSLEPEPVPPASPPPVEPAPVPAVRQVEPPRAWVVAVMEAERLHGDEPNDELLRALSERLRTRLAEARWRVVDRTAQETRWAEIIEAEKHRSYRECDDPACQVPLGRALSASHLLRSSVSRFGDTCVLGAELIELESEVVVAARTEQGPCEPLSLLGSADKLLKELGNSLPPPALGER